MDGVEGVREGGGGVGDLGGCLSTSQTSAGHGSHLLQPPTTRSVLVWINQPQKQNSQETALGDLLQGLCGLRAMRCLPR